MHPYCFLDNFCRKCDVFGHHLLHCDAPRNPAMPPGGFLKARSHLPRLPYTRTDPVALARTPRPPVVSHNVYDVLDMDTGDENEQSFSRSIECAIGGVNIAVFDASGDLPEAVVAEAENTAVLRSLKDLWVELQTYAGNEDAGQKLVM